MIRKKGAKTCSLFLIFLIFTYDCPNGMLIQIYFLVLSYRVVPAQETILSSYLLFSSPWPPSPGRLSSVKNISLEHYRPSI